MALGWDPILPGGDRTLMSLLSINLIEKTSGLCRGFDEPTSRQKLKIDYTASSKAKT